MEHPIKTIVNTSEDTIFTKNISSPNFGSDRQGLITVNIERPGPNVSWGFRLQGGQDRGLAFQLLKVPLNSVAGEAGCRSNDYLVKINGVDVFTLSHDKAKQLIKDGGDKLSLVIERGDHIVPNMNDAFPHLKKKPEGPTKEKPYYQRHLEETGELPGQQGKGFTTVGKPKMATKQYNSPIEMYGEEALDEIMEQGTLFGKEIDPQNPWNMTGKQLDLNKSAVLSQINSSEPKIQSE